jgi:hypothetical protein
MKDRQAPREATRRGVHRLRPSPIMTLMSAGTDAPSEGRAVASSTLLLALRSVERAHEFRPASKQSAGRDHRAGVPQIAAKLWEPSLSFLRSDGYHQSWKSNCKMANRVAPNQNTQRDGAAEKSGLRCCSRDLAPGQFRLLFGNTSASGQSLQHDSRADNWQLQGPLPANCDPHSEPLRESQKSKKIVSSSSILNCVIEARCCRYISDVRMIFLSKLGK